LGRWSPTSSCRHSPRGRLGIAAAVATVFACALGAAGAAGADQLEVTVSSRPADGLGTDRPAAPIASGFVGVSTDWCSILRYTGVQENPILVHLLRNLAPVHPVLRIGGDGTDGRCHGKRTERGPTRSEATALATVAGQADARLILGINLEAHSVTLARRQSALLERALGRRGGRLEVQAIEIGNEPDRYPIYGGHVRASAIGPFFNRYLSDFGTWTGIVRQVFEDPTFPVAGPSLGRFGLPWISGPNRGNFARLLDAAAHPALVTFHTYPLLASAACPSAMCPELQNLLLQRSSGGLARLVSPYVALAAGRVPVRVDEINSATKGGVVGVSNTFASALWAADTLFELASAGVKGVNVHTFSAARYALFSHQRRGGWRVHPEYYGLLLFARAAPAGSRLLRVTPGLIGNVGAPDVKVWATRGPGSSTRIVVINKDVRAHTLTLRGSGVPLPSTVALAQLDAPGKAPSRGTCPPLDAPTGLCATGGVSFGGSSFGPRVFRGLGGDQAATGLLGPPAAGTCTRLLCVPQPPDAPRQSITVDVAAGSAVLLTGRTPPPAAPGPSARARGPRGRIPGRHG
jgi:hypothetical protein